MTLKHTPGPWRVSREYNGTFIRAAHGGLVASLESGSQAMRDADAPLVAAAPDLLAALQYLTAELQVASDSSDGAYSKAVDVGFAAIAKATGEL